MKIRLMGLKDELDIMCNLFRQIDQTRSISAYYPNRNSKEYRCYIEIDIQDDMFFEKLDQIDTCTVCGCTEFEACEGGLS